MLNHGQLRELFLKACDLPEDQQSDFVEEQCANHKELRQELQLLLRTDARKDGIFADDKTTDGIKFQFDTVVDSEMPEQIGQYQVKKLLGEGGMGVVYLAEQQKPRRDVAIKVIRSGMASTDMLKRFELEAAVLGRLTHPGIARIYEAGSFVDNSTGHERPFLAMEFVDGQPLQKFVKQTDPDKRERLELFHQICEAVHHAHQRGIIHRDVKPGNVLVRADGQPVVLDFGVARASGLDPGMSTLQTRAGQLIGTLPYMSPEQVTGNTLDVDTRSDVYSLGVIAYELLSGKLPYDVADVEYLKAAKVISEESPVSLSLINREFRGDINTVVLKALEKEPDRRYQSAKALGDDIQRYLDNQPVLARPATTLYQLKQFAKRNKAFVGGLLMSMILLIGGVVGTTRGMIDARQSAERKSAINEFMKDILVAEDSSSGNADIMMVEVLRDAADSAPERFKDYPELEAEVCHLLGTAFTKLTLYQDAIELHRRAFELRKSKLGISHPLTRQAGVGVAKLVVGYDASGAIEIASELLAHTQQAQVHDQDVLQLQIVVAKALTRTGNFGEAEELVRDVLSLASSINLKDETILREARVCLAKLLWVRVGMGKSRDVDKDSKETIELYRNVISELKQQFSDDHVQTLGAQLKLVDALRSIGDYQDAERVAKQVHESASQRHGDDNEFITLAKKDLADIHYRLGKFESAANYFVDSVGLLGELSDPDQRVMGFLNDGLPYVEAGDRFEDGEEYARLLLEKFSGAHGRQDNLIRLYLARFLSDREEKSEAEDQFEKVVESGELESNILMNSIYVLFQAEHELAHGAPAVAAEMFDEAMSLRNQVHERASPSIGRFKNGIERAKAAIDGGQ